MTRVTLCSAKGSPGVTTLSCVLGAVWPADRAVVVAECDPSGGDLAGRFGLSTRVGMTSLVLTDRQGAVGTTDYRAHVQQLPGGLDVLVAPPGPDSASALDRELGVTASDLIPPDCDLLADCGQLLPGAAGQEKMIRAADDVILLVRPDVTGIAHARWATMRIRALSTSVASVVLVGAGAFTTAEVAEELDVHVVGVVPFDPGAALMACGSPGTTRRFIRSGLVAFAREMAAALVDGTPTSSIGDQGRGERGRTGDVPERRHRIKETVSRVSRAPRGSRAPRARADDRTPAAAQ
jgi:MinD-like ATPase involved in chromosome partitioning or flagellar assembly